MALLVTPRNRNGDDLNAIITVLLLLTIPCSFACEGHIPTIPVPIPKIGPHLKKLPIPLPIPTDWRRISPCLFLFLFPRVQAPSLTKFWHLAFQSGKLLQALLRGRVSCKVQDIPAMEHKNLGNFFAFFFSGSCPYFV
jgi:hypothetical protein